MNEDIGAKITGLNFVCPDKKALVLFSCFALMQDENLASEIKNFKICENSCYPLKCVWFSIMTL